MSLGLATFRRAPISGLTAVTVVTALVLVPVANANAAVTPLVAQAFTGSSVTNEWYLPPAASGTNDTCLTAGTLTTQLPIPGCNLATPDASGSGTLRLTPNTGSKVGSTFYQTSLPTSAGLDIKFNTYQYNATSTSGADGIGFALTAVDPANPTPPVVTGPVGGSLGYTTTGASKGIPYGYIGYGADAWGNFANSTFGGSTCTLPAGLTAGKAYPENLTVRGPGNNTTGYCILGTTASVAPVANGGGSGGTVSNLGGGFLDVQSSTTRPRPVAAELAMNPTNAAATTASGLSVPANSYLIQVTPYTSTTGATLGSPQVLTGLLPTTANNTTLAGFPSSWINPATGVPYQVAFGWVASTGGSNEIHEVDSLVATTLSGQLPVLGLGMTDNESGKFLTSNQAVITLSPSVTLAGGPEIDPLTVTDVFPTGLVPGTATSSSLWTCTTVGQKVTCTYAPSVPIPAGTSLPAITIPVTTASALANPLTNTARMGSIDGAPDATTLYYATSTLGASVSAASVPYGTAAVLGTTGLPSNATGTVVYKSGATTLCTIVLASATTCSTGTALAPGTYPVTATYSGDTAYLGATASTTFTVTKATTAITATAAPTSTGWGNAVTLTAGNVPGPATGSIVFTSGATTLCTATLPTLSCLTSSTLAAGTYPVTATYAGDSNYTGSTASTSFTIVPTATTFTVAPTPATVTYGTATSLAETGLPVGATGTVTYKTGATTLCVATLPAISCTTPTTQGAGSVPVTATYSGDSHYATSTATTSYLVNKAATAVAAAATPASTPYGTADTLSDSNLPAAATGTVTFASGGTTLCVATLPATSCTAPASLVVGSYATTATYSGDSNFTGSTDTTTFTVTKAASPFTATAAPASVSYGTAVTLAESGIVSGATGTVTFASGGSTLCVATLPATSCATGTALDPASYPVTATYSGDSNHASSSATTSFAVTKVASPFTAAAAPASAGFGNSVTLSESGIASGATGTVTFASGGSTLCVATLPATSCGTSATLAAGPYPVVATYSGDIDHATSTASTSFTITTVATAFTASATPATVTYGAVVTLAETGLAANATGTVTFASGGSPLCVATLPATSCGTSTTLAVGSYPTTATYSGDGNYVGSTATTSFAVTKIASPVTASVTPATTPYETSTTLKESGLPAAATGTVTFTSGGTTLCTVTLGSGNTCATPATLVVGTYPVTATYSGDATHLGSTDTTSFTVTKEPTSFTAAPTPASAPYGTKITLTDAGLVAGATGTITFASGGTTLCTLDVTTDTSCDTAATLNPAVYPVTATYGGDANHASSTASTSFTITKAPAPFTAKATPASVVFGNAVTLSATSLPAGATGTVTFASGGTTLCTVTLSSGTSCLTSASLDPGSYPVTATYSGDAHFASATDTTTFAVTPQATALAVSATPASVAYSTAVTLGESGLPAGATGTVTLDWGTGSTCVVTLGSATSCATPATLAPGSYTVTGSYSGDVDYSASTATSAFVVTKAPTAVVAGATPAHVTYGSADTLKESGLPGGATGTVAFTSGGTTLCTVTLGGPATCATPATLPAGSYPVTATYSGDAHFTGSVDTVTFVVDPAATAITAAATPGSVAFGSPVTLSAGNLPAGGTGTLTFTSGGATLCTTTLPTLSCVTPSTLPAATYPVVATYSGDNNFSGSSATTTFDVTAATTHLAVGASPATTTHGNPITLTTGGLPADATGLVTFTYLGSTLCTVDVAVTSTCSTSSTLAVGNYGTVTGSYAGDANHAPSSATTTFAITMVVSSLSATATPASVAYGTAVTLSEGNLASDATGTVTFTSGGTTLCSVDVATATSCDTSATLAVGTYPVTATYSGDGSHSGATATTSFVVGTAATAVSVAATPGTVSYGTAVTLSEANLPGAATGTVTFTSGGTTLCTVDVATATSCSTSASLAPGAYPVTGTYSGDAHFAGSSDTTSFAVTKAPTSITGSAPASSPYATPVTVTIGGLPSGATGVVTAKSGTLTLCTVTLPATSCVVSTNLPPATYTATVDYPGDAHFVGSTDTFGFTVTTAPTALTAAATPASVVYLQPVTLSPGNLPSDATGTVTFTSGGTTLCTVDLATATSCLTSSSLPAATYPVLATYPGDSHYDGSTATTTFTVGALATSFTVTATPPTASFGSAVTLTPSGLPAGATGTVVMKSGATTLCTVTLGTGTTCDAPASTPVGSYPVTAYYSGDSNFAGSTATTSFTVVKAPAPFTAAASPTPSPYGTVVTLSDSGLPAGATGTVRFHTGATTYCVATLPATSCSTSATLDPATYPVTADYSGDGSHVASIATTSFEIDKAPVTMTAAATPTGTAYGNAVTLSGGGLPGGATGTVTFASGGTTLCVVALPATSCATSSTLAVATYPVTATYSGDVDHLGATATTSFAIGKAATTVSAAASPGSVTYGTPVTLTEGGLPATATGTVTFTAGGQVLCIVDITTATGCPTSSSLPAGTYTVTATYSGDPSWAGSTGTTTFTVTQATVTMSAVATPPTVVYGHPSTLVPSGLPAGATGTVIFTSGTMPLCTVTLGSATSCDTSATVDTGVYAIDATYSGDANYAGVVAATSLTVTKAPVTITASASPSSTSYGTQVLLTTTGIPAGATGTVAFVSGGAPLCTATLPATGCGTSSALPVGSYDVTVTYSGDSNHAPATTSTSFVVTTAASTLTAAANPAAVPHGSATTLTYAGLPAGATGTVSFSAGGVVLCTATVGTQSGCLTSVTLATGDYAVTATYSGDPHYAGETATTGFTVGPVASTFHTSGPVRTPQQTSVTEPNGDTITLLDNEGKAVLKVLEPGQGTYTLNPKTGVITFTPVSTFVGVADPVRYRITDPAGQSDTGTYRALVVAPTPPHPAGLSTTGPVDSLQHAIVAVPRGDTATLVDGHGHQVQSLQLAGAGTYTMKPGSGQITFQPEHGFIGTPPPVTFAVVDPFAQVGAATYQATVYGTTVPPAPVHGSPLPFEPPGIPVNLPFTGFNAERLMLVTAFMVALGTVMVVGSRRSVTGRFFGHAD
ncbi:hypothetical protein acdb102_11950 [Acidothermaceae bacterium B102]|nr:hypothetical protein acdb102_11950 [Acidothermaceae bacterium B102]